MAKRNKIDSRGSNKERSQDNNDQVFSYESHPWVAHSVR
jgi:hypothetical protein